MTTTPASRWRLFVPDPRRDRSIETLRGVACLLIVAYHVIGASATEGLQVPDDSPWRYFADTFVYLRMPLFTFLSGLVYAMRPVTPSTALPGFAAGKARRLLIPMWFYGTLFALSQTYLPGANNPTSVPWYLWNIIPVGPYWFLASMMWVFLAVALLEKVRAFSRLDVTIAICVAVILVDAILPDWTNWLGWRSAIYLFPFFVVGIVARRFDWRGAPRWLKISVIATAAVLLVYTQLGIFGIVPQVEARHTIIAGVLGSALCLTLFLTRWSFTPLVVIGAFSFTIYTAQIFGVGVMRYLLSKVGVDNIAISVVLCMIAGIVLPIGLELVARRSRLLSTLLLGQKWSRKKSPATRTPSSKEAG